jgi:hypothetical protein
MGERCTYNGFDRGDVKEISHLECLSVGGKLLLEGLYKEEEGDVDWFDLTQNVATWQSLVNTAVTLQIL